MHLLVTPGAPLCGDIRVAADKSISHRAVIFAAIAHGTSRLRNLSDGEDVRATVDAFRRMGVGMRQLDADGANGADGGDWEINGVGLRGLSPPDDALDCGNSGTAMRLLAGLLCAQPWPSTLTGDASLCARPMARIIEPLAQMGARITAAEPATARPPLTISPAPALRGIHYPLPVASAQVKSAVLLAGLYADGDTIVSEPAPTRDHTERMLAAFGGRVLRDGGGVGVRGGGGAWELRATDTPLRAPADLSAAAFFLVGASIIRDSEVVLRGVGVNPTRSGVLTILRRMGADIEVMPRADDSGGEPVADIQVRYPPQGLRGCDIGGDDIALAIDEIPALAVAAACARGRTDIRDAAELRVKESDRLSAVAAGLRALGVAVEEHADGLSINGGGLSGGRVDSHADHRIAMAFAIAGGAAGGTVEVRDCDNIATSFPEFTRVARAAGLGLDEQPG